MKRTLFTGFVSVLMLLMVVGASTAGEEAGFVSRGVWFTTIFLGPPGEAGTPVIQYSITASQENTWYLDGTHQTGEHPLFPNPATTATGVIIRTGPHSSITKGFWFAANPPRLGRSICELTMEDPDTSWGLCSFDHVPCAVGAIGEPVCPDPSDLTPIELGDPQAGTAFPTLMKRFR